jgi:tetratricopeptide (TPR) repeat protein
VATSRSSDADLTQEGAIMGTPAYMPPEQATGQIHAIDQRSDIYSLGAILYEMLTLQAPVDKEGGYLSILMRVTEGNIVPPAQREPKRAKAGKIPAELAAIAMKALAKEPEGRYQSVEELRKDIELFQDGRSVSAKQDTKREMIWKFVKRNKGFSVGVGVAFFVLLASLVLLFQAWRKASDAYDRSAHDQEELAKLGRESVPAFVHAARLLRDEGRFEDALKQTNVALHFAPQEADAHLLRGQLLIGDQRYPEALAELEACLKVRPGDAAATKLVELSRAARLDHSGSLLALAEELARQKALALADRVSQRADKLVKSRTELLPYYRQRLEAAWPGAGANLAVNDQGFGLTLSIQWKTVNDLTPLQGMKLTSLNLTYCSHVRDLTPLQGMKLTHLSLMNCFRVRDLTPLQGMPLTTLDLYGCPVQDVTPLQGMKLTKLILWSSELRDLAPLRGMPLTTLDLSRCGQVSDLTPLREMKLTHLSLLQCSQVRNLSPLRGMPLTLLNLADCVQVEDLTPLKGMPLTRLWLGGCERVKDLRPLEGLPLEEINLTPKFIRKESLDVLRQMKSLKTISDSMKSYTSAEFWRKYDAGEFNK